jgi:Ni/Co efflux regulator RcnB
MAKRSPKLSPTDSQEEDMSDQENTQDQEQQQDQQQDQQQNQDQQEQVVDYSPKSSMPDSEPFRPLERIPSNWKIAPLDNGDIEAVNNNTLRVFVGTVEQFNSMLRG